MVQHPALETWGVLQWPYSQDLASHLPIINHYTQNPKPFWVVCSQAVIAKLDRSSGIVHGCMLADETSMKLFFYSLNKFYLNTVL